MTMQELAEACVQQGYPVFPCKPENKQPYVNGGFKAATTDIDQINAWWAQWPDAMPGIPTGDVTGIFVLDIDEHGDVSGNRTLAGLEQRYGKLPVTWEASTPSGGRHLHPSGHPPLQISIPTRPRRQKRLSTPSRIARMDVEMTRSIARHLVCLGW